MAPTVHLVGINRRQPDARITDAEGVAIMHVGHDACDEGCGEKKHSKLLRYLVARRR